MFKIKLLLFLMFLWMTAGCQQVYNNTSSILYDKAQTPSLDTQKPVTLSDPVLSIPAKTDLTASGIEKESYKQNQESEKQDQDQDQEPELTAQEKIDQALELCASAQQMWEKGNIDDALTSLDSAYSTILEIDTEIHSELNQDKEDIRYLISKRILEFYASRQIVVNGQHNEIPLTLNKHVEDEINSLTGPERNFFIQSLERSERFRPFIISELKKAGLPEEISWLPLIESGFKIRALSSARALGLWQFIPSTGYKFGLMRNYYIDERLDLQKSTIAAISYLKELHNLFGDWTTVLAAYNCGENRVLRIIRDQKINYLDNFWDLYQKLPRETARYVPRFLATLHIVNNLEKYNIEIGVPLSPIAFETYEIEKQISLKNIAKELDINEDILLDLNPELRYGLLPPEAYQIKIPEDKAQIFLSNIDKIKTTYSPPPPPPMYVSHRVRRGDTLSGLAKMYRTSIPAIAAANHMNKSHTIIVGNVLKIPNRNIAGNIYADEPVAHGQSFIYKVKSGDNLWNIAGKFNTTTKSIMATNKLSSTKLIIGQSLNITSEKPLETEQLKIAKKKDSTYKVRSGDSPIIIAKKYNMSLNRLFALNDLNKKSTIFPGQNLIVE